MCGHAIHQHVVWSNRRDERSAGGAAPPTVPGTSGR